MDHNRKRAHEAVRAASVMADEILDIWNRLDALERLIGIQPSKPTHYDAPRCQNTSMGQQCDLEAGHDGVHWHRDGANINVWYTDPEQWERMVKLPTPKWRPDDSGYIVEISQSPTISGVMWFWEVGTPRGERNPKTGLYPPRWWRSGCAFTRWGAKRQAMRAIKRRETPDNWETFTVGGAS